MVSPKEQKEMGEIQSYRERREVMLLLAVQRVELKTVMFLAVRMRHYHTGCETLPVEWLGQTLLIPAVLNDNLLTRHTENRIMG